MEGLRKLLSFMGGKKYGYILGIVVTACTETSIYIVISFVLRDMYNAGTHTDMSILIKAVKLLGLTTIFTGLLYGLFSYLYNSFTRQVMADVRRKVYSLVEDLPVSYFEVNHSGDVMSRMTNDMQLLEQIYSQQVYSLVYTVIYGSTSAVVMLFTDWKLSLIFLFIGAVLLCLNSRLAGVLRLLGKQIQELQGRMTSRLSDLFSGLKVIRIFHMEHITYGDYSKLNQMSVLLNKKRADKNALIESLNFLMGTVSYVGLVAIGVFMATTGRTEMDKVIGMTQLMMGVTFMFQQLGNTIASLQGSLAGAGRIVELMEEKPEPDEYENLMVCDDLEESVLIENLNFGYDRSQKVLEDINLKILEGEFVAIVGSSGSGKSTLIKMMLGFYKPDSGRILVKNNGLNNYSIRHLRDLISYVSQDVCLFSGTIEENIRYGRADAKREEIVEACKAAYAHDFIMEFEEGYNTIVGENGSRLSGGQRQRIAIARALLKNSPIILLDEATSALDSQTEQLVQKAIMELIRGKTAIVIAHRLTTVENADRIYVMDNGKIMESGRHSELLKKKGVYYRLSRIQAMEL